MTPTQARAAVEEAISAYGRACQNFAHRVGADADLIPATGDLLLAIRALESAVLDATISRVRAIITRDAYLESEVYEAIRAATEGV